MQERLKLVVAYDGRPFAGWQSQAHGETVQDYLEKALSRVNGKKVKVHGAGRTDRGVHALGQCAHADVTRNRLTPDRWVMALNAVLPPTIRVMSCRRVSLQFHARYSAKGKIYRYRIWNGPVLPPLELGRVWHIPRPFDFELLSAGAAKFRGRHDFAAFAANRGKPEPDTVRTIAAVKVKKSGSLVTFEFSGDGFLYKMVRMMVAAAVQCAQGRITPAAVAEMLRGGGAAKTQFVAPGEGLFLLRVRY